MTQMLSLAGRSCSGSRQSLPGLCSNKKGALRFAASFGFVSVLPTTQVLIAANRQSECDNCFGSSCVVCIKIERHCRQRKSLGRQKTAS